MYLLTELEGRTAKYLAVGHAYGPSAKYFPVRPNLNSVNKQSYGLFTLFMSTQKMKLGKIKKKTKICTENLSNMLFAFAFVAVNYLDV